MRKPKSDPKGPEKKTERVEKMKPEAQISPKTEAPKAAPPVEAAAEQPPAATQIKMTPIVPKDEQQQTSATAPTADAAPSEPVVTPPIASASSTSSPTPNPQPPTPKRSLFGMRLGGGATPKPVIKKAKQVKAPGRISYIGIGKERNSFVQNLATLLNAGLPLTDCLQTLMLETRPKTMKKLIQRMIDLIESGSPLWKAMNDQHFFTPYAIALVRIGEEAGSLARNMQYLSEQQEKDQALKSKVKMAMIYPAIVMSLVFFVVIGLGGFVLPNLIPVLHALNTDLPLTTRIVIAVSDFFTKQGYIAIPGCIFVFVGIFLLHTFTRFRRVTQWLIFQIPGIGRLAKEATIARFGVILGGLLRAGVPLTEALKSMAEVTWIVSYKTFYEKLTENITLGMSFQKCFQSIRGSEKLLPISVQSLVVVGEKSGSLADILIKISDIYDRKASDTAQKLPVILEPVLLIFMGGLVGTIAFAIIMPIYSVVGNIG